MSNGCFACKYIWNDCLGKKQSFHIYLQAKQLIFVRNSLFMYKENSLLWSETVIPRIFASKTARISMKHGRTVSDHSRLFCLQGRKFPTNPAVLLANIYEMNISYQGSHYMYICKQNSLDLGETAFSCLFASKTVCLGKKQSFHVYLQAKQLRFI